MKKHLGTERFEKLMEKAIEHEKALTRQQAGHRVIERGNEFER